MLSCGRALHLSAMGASFHGTESVLAVAPTSSNVVLVATLYLADEMTPLSRECESCASTASFSTFTGSTTDSYNIISSLRAFEDLKKYELRKTKAREALALLN